MYFKKGIDDAASEWAQHHAKRWLDTSGKACSHTAVLSTLSVCLRLPEKCETQVWSYAARAVYEISCC